MTETETETQTETTTSVDRQHVSADVAPELFDEPSADASGETGVDIGC